jgi:hypothetical protein
MNTQYVILITVYLSASIILGPVIVSYIYTRSKYGQKIAEKIMFRVVSIYVAFVILLFALTLSVISMPATSNFPFEQIGMIALGFGAIMSIAILSAIIYLIYLWHQSRTQKRLLVLPYGTYQLVYILLGAMFLLITIFRFANNRSMDIEKILMGTYLALIGFFMVLLGCIKQTITQDGIYFGIIFVEWKSIKSYMWEGEKPFLLKIQANRPFIFGNVTLAVRDEVKASVDAILREYVDQR